MVADIHVLAGLALVGMHPWIPRIPLVQDHPRQILIHIVDLHEKGRQRISTVDITALKFTYHL